jgi:hypothetical protein
MFTKGWSLYSLYCIARVGNAKKNGLFLDLFQVMLGPQILRNGSRIFILCLVTKFPIDFYQNFISKFTDSRGCDLQNVNANLILSLTYDSLRRPEK